MRISVAMVLLFTIPAGGQESKQHYSVPAPKGWGKETIALPPAFAKNMTWKGVEELRFSPGMFMAESDTFFSYGILQRGVVRIGPFAMDIDRDSSGSGFDKWHAFLEQLQTQLFGRQFLFCEGS